MALTKLDVKGIKDGTDGQLITWDTNTIADTVATGTNLQVLTSNGAGTKPTFQDTIDNAAAMALALGG